MMKDWRKYNHYVLTTASMEESIGAAVATSRISTGYRHIDEFLDAVKTALQEHYDADVKIVGHDLLQEDMRYIRTIRICVERMEDYEYFENILLTPLFIY